MACQFPFILQSVANLSAMGVQSQSIRFGQLSMESDHYVCIREDASEGANANTQVIVIDLHNNNNITRKPMKAELAMMNPTHNIMALKGKNEGQPGGSLVQVYNLDTKEKLGTHLFTENVVLWKWLNNEVIGVVTPKSVYHWFLSNDYSNTKAPEKIFDRAAKLTDTQIINYTVDKDFKWCLLTGISSSDNGKTVEGTMQLYSVERKQQQLLEGHAGCFGDIIVDESKGYSGVFSFFERKKDLTPKLHIMDIYASRGEGLPTPFKVSNEIQLDTENQNDFPVGMHISKSHGCIFMATKGGYVYVFEASSATAIFKHRVSQDPVFLTCENSTNGGINLVNRKGVIYTAMINENSIIPYIQNNLTHLSNRNQLVINLASRYGLPGADEFLVQQFNQSFACGEYKLAARIAAVMKSGALRTPQTIQQFKNAPTVPGQSSPILQYFSVLLDLGKLNSFESIELVKPVVTQGRTEFIEKWLRENKLECTEELGDIVKPLNTKIALSIYLLAQCPPKVIQCFIELSQFDKIVLYAKKANYQPDYSFILRNMMAVNHENTVTLAKQLLENDPPLIDINQLIDVFLQHNRVQEITSIMLDYLKENKPEHAFFQTKLLEINLLHADQLAETIFQMEMFTHYDRYKIAMLCEKAGMYQRALEHFTDINDIKRVMLQTGGQISVEWLQSFFSRMPPDTCLEILTDMLRTNRQNLQVVVSAAIKFNEQIGTDKLIQMFETFNSYEGIFYFLGSILAFTQNPEVHFKYIEAAAKLNHIQEVERVCRESKHYDPVRVKEFLKQSKLSDPRPLIYVCDIHGYVTELAEYLYKNSLMKYIEVYVVKVNPQNAAYVIGTLIDLDCSEDYIKSLLQTIRGNCSVSTLVEEVEKRNRLRLLLPWLEARMLEGNQEPELHNAIAKIYIDTNRDAETFLNSNSFYDSKIVGKYCEDRDPHLAYLAYKRAWGACDEQLIDVTNKNGLFRLQARYLVDRQSPELWSKVLSESNEFRRNLIDQVVSSALPESTNADEVSTAVKAFIEAQLPNELIELLEKIVLHNSNFSNNKNLQNLLIFTAIKADKSRVMDYINRLNNYDGPEIAKIALSNQYNLLEEAFVIFKKFNMNTNAIDTLLSIEAEGNLERAAEFASRCNEDAVWSKLGEAQLRAGRVVESIESYLKAGNAENYTEVIEAAKAAEKYDELIMYLQMARKKLTSKDQMIDSELVYAFAKSDRLGEMEEFIFGSNTANIQNIGDRLFQDKMFKAAKILYSSIPNNAKLASCHVYLGEFSQSVEAAKKANNPKTWKDINFSCVNAKEYKCAHIAGLHLIVHPDHLDDLIIHYENNAIFDELIVLLEAGVAGERSHVGVYTELGIAYAKYMPEKLMELCRTHSSKVNIPKLIRECEKQLLWREAVHLHISYDEFDQAANTMMSHGPIAWTHEQFIQIMQKISNAECLYRAVNFYLDQHPLQLNSLLKSIEKKIDHARVVQQIRKLGHLPLIQQYLLEVQHHNITAVNEAVNELLLETEDCEALRDSISEYDNFDQLVFACKLEKHDLSEMRRLAVILYKKNKKHKQALELCKLDQNYHDAVETARDSGNQSLVEELLKFFVDTKNKECFAACLYVCYDLVRPDIALELAWKNGYLDQVMPFIIQVVREYSYRVDLLDKKVEHREQEEEKQKSAPNDYIADCGIIGGNFGIGAMAPGMGNLALMPPPVNNINKSYAASNMNMVSGSLTQNGVGIGVTNQFGFFNKLKY